MIAWFKQLDDLLRGRKTAPQMLAEGKIELPLRMFLVMAIGLGLTYGFFVGWFAIFSHEIPGYQQLIASTVKLPALFICTLIVTFPSLYVFNALVGCRLSFTATLRLLVGAIVVNLTVAASFGPILGFFTLCTQSYAFMILINVLLLTIAGIVSLAFLLHTLRRLAAPLHPPTTLNPPSNPHNNNPNNQIDNNQRQPGPLETPYQQIPDQALGQSKAIFRIWVIIYSLVGAQMGWLLRPFIGDPTLPFEWFRERQGNFFLAVSQHFMDLMMGK
ncbi:MAG: hypothetical protein ACYTF1_18200 [Planctomycetota bacterium]|jgi:hypothetical protein